jgi:hypothetical protein
MERSPSCAGVRGVTRPASLSHQARVRRVTRPIGTGPEIPNSRPPIPDLAGNGGTPVSRFDRESGSRSQFGGPGTSWSVSPLTLRKVRLKAQAWADTPLRLCPQFTHCSHSGETSKLLFSKLAANNFPDPESLATAVKTYIDTGAPRSTVATRKPSSAFRHVASDGRERDGDRCRSRQQLQHLLAWPVQPW